jgi:phenylalanyl-tRNA synthetase beta chain
VTYSFIDEASAKLFGGGDDATRLENPISSEMSHMRPALLPGLLQAAARNQARGMMDLALFEVGHAFHGGEPTEQHLQAVGLLVGQSGPRDPHGARRPVDVFDVKADAEAVLSAMGARQGADPARRARAGGIPVATAWSASAPRRCWASSGNCTRRCWRRWT